MGKKTDLESPARSPIDFGPISNGEFMPRPPRPIDAIADRLVQELADERARRLGLSRRTFLAGAAGTATALGVINTLSGCDAFRLSASAAEHPAEAAHALAAKVPDAFVIDVQTHHVEAS